MFVCLIIGSLLITGILSSIPMYTAGTLRQMLAIELKRYEDEYGVPSGQMFFEAKIPNSRFGMSRVDMCGEISDKVLGGLEDSRVTAKDSFVNLVADKFHLLTETTAFRQAGIR